ncbi:hypothetical protein R3P38DRAFT_3222671 [Favolaschia claudopus]|uniref:Uncharacterized protein n=1 Tax=Favolaschia claudopus TaxID=2862362 RepID=A0AAV9ZYH5_9AGAR
MSWEATADERDCDPTLCFLGLYSLQTTGEFHGPDQTTGPIARICWALRLVMLRQIHILCDGGICTDQLAAFNEIAPFIKEHNINTFSSLQSLQHYASSIVMSTMPLPSIVFLDRVNWTSLYFKGQYFSLEKFQNILRGLEEEILNLWNDQIMLGFNIRVDYGDLVDNLKNQKPGYSFITLFRIPRTLSLRTKIPSLRRSSRIPIKQRSSFSAFLG